jgi:hypothetical protein
MPDLTTNRRTWRENSGAMTLLLDACIMLYLRKPGVVIGHVFEARLSNHTGNGKISVVDLGLGKFRPML